MPATLRLTTTLEPRGPAAAVVLTDDQVHELAGGPRTPAVTVTVNGTYTFEGRVGRRGGENLVGFNRAVREAAGVSPGEEIEVEITADLGAREVAVPDDLARALGTAGASGAFEALAPSHRKEYVRWITEAKKPETRARRVAEAVERVAEGRPRR